MKKIRHHYIIAGILFLGLVFLNNHSLSLWDQDEAAYAGFAHEMNASGDYLIPGFIWSDVHRKPPLHFWAISICYSIFGESEFSTRLPSSLAMMGGSFLFLIMGFRIWGKRKSEICFFILSTSWVIVSLGKISVTDGLLFFFESLALLSLLNNIHKPNWKYYLLFFIGVTGAALTKGPPIVILMGGILGIGILFKSHRKEVICHILLSLLGIIPLLLWGYLAWMRDGGTFIKWLIDWYILARAKGAVFGQTGPPGYFLLIYSVSILPWIPFLIPAVKNWIRALFPIKNWRIESGLMVGWLLAGLIFYELVPSKLPAYGLMGLPFLAYITSVYLEEGFSWKSGLRFGIWIYRVMSILGGLILIAIPFADVKLGIPLHPITSLIGLLLFLSGTLSFFFFGKKGVKTGFSIMIAVHFLFLFLAWGFVIPGFEKERSISKRLSVIIEEIVTENTKVFLGHNFRMPSLPFYLKQNERIVKEEYEYQKLKKILMSERGAAVIVENEIAYKLNKELGPENVLILNRRGWLSDKGKEVSLYLVFSKRCRKPRRG